MHNSDISIIITGPIDDRTFESIDSYYDQGFEEVIVSTWKDEDLSLLNKTKKEYKLILSDNNAFDDTIGSIDDYPQDLKDVISNFGQNYIITVRIENDYVVERYQFASE